MKKNKVLSVLLSSILAVSLMISPSFAFFDEDIVKINTEKASSYAVQPKASPDVISKAANTIPNFEYKYFLLQLDDRLLKDAAALYEGITDFQSKIKLPEKVNADEAKMLIEVLRYECPELIQLDNRTSYSIYSKSNLKTQINSLGLEYIMTKEEYSSCLAACNEVVESIAMNTLNLSDEQKEIKAYEYIVKNTLYDADALHASTAYGALIQKKAKCDGISLAMKMIMDKMGVSCVVVPGIEDGETIGHAWNIIKINGNYYDLDITTDVGMENQDGIMLYPAYNVSSTWIRSIYKPLPTVTKYFQMPGSSTMGNSYYAKNNMFLYKGTNTDPYIKNLVAYAYQNGKAQYAMQFEDKAEYNAFVNSLEKKIKDEVYKYNLSGRYSAKFMEIYRVVLITVSINN